MPAMLSASRSPQVLSLQEFPFKSIVSRNFSKKWAGAGRMFPAQEKNQFDGLDADNESVY